MARFQYTVFENEHPLGDAPPLAVPTLNIQLRCGRKRGRIGLCVGMIIWRNQLNRLAEACVHRAAADGAVVEEAPSARRKSHHCRCRNTHFCVGPLKPNFPYQKFPWRMCGSKMKAPLFLVSKRDLDSKTDLFLECPK